MSAETNPTPLEMSIATFKIVRRMAVSKKDGRRTRQPATRGDLVSLHSPSACRGSLPEGTATASLMHIVKRRQLGAGGSPTTCPWSARQWLRVRGGGMNAGHALRLASKALPWQRCDVWGRFRPGMWVAGGDPGFPVSRIRGSAFTLHLASTFYFAPFDLRQGGASKVAAVRITTSHSPTRKPRYGYRALLRPVTALRVNRGFLVPPREKRPRLAFILASAESEALPGARACFAGSTGAVLPVCAASAKRPCCYASNSSSSAGKKSGAATKLMRVLKWCMCIGMPHAVQWVSSSTRTLVRMTAMRATIGARPAKNDVDAFHDNPLLLI